MTVTDLVEGALPVPTDHLRQRVRQMDSAARDHLLSADPRFVDLADGDGGSVLLPREVYAAVEQAIADHEPPSPGLLAGLTSRYQRLEPGPRIAAASRLEHHGIATPDAIAPDDLTLGRAMTIERILDDVLAESEKLVAEALGFVQQGSVVTEPVLDAAELASYIDWPKMSVKELVAYVGDDADLAAAALVYERSRAKPRSGVLSKIEPLAASRGTAPAAEPSGEVGAQEPEAWSEGTTPEACASAASPDPDPGAAPSAAGSADPLGADDDAGAAPEPSTAQLAAADGVDGSTPSSGTQDSPPTAAGEGVAESGGSTAAPSATGLAKYAAMLGRLGAEMVALSKLIEADLHRVDL